MRSIDPNFEAIGSQISARLQDRKNRSCHCPQHKLYERLQQMALMCRLFNKKIRITYQSGTDMQTIETTMYLTTPKTVILQNGQFIQLCDVSSVKIC